MTKAITKLIYKHETPPGAPPGGEFIMLVEDKNAYERYKGGDHSVPLVSIFDALAIYYSNSGHTGVLGEASLQQLESLLEDDPDADPVEETSKKRRRSKKEVEDAVIHLLLQKGTLQHSERLDAKSMASKNDARGDVAIKTTNAR